MYSACKALILFLAARWPQVGAFTTSLQIPGDIRIMFKLFDFRRSGNVHIAQLKQKREVTNNACVVALILHRLLDGCRPGSDGTHLKESDVPEIAKNQQLAALLLSQNRHPINRHSMNR